MSIANKCKIDGCDGVGLLRPNGRRSFRRGLCVKHYGRLMKYGDVDSVKIDMHGGRSKAEYSSYYNMKARCYNKKHTSYKNYGARGIKVCDRWLGVRGFRNFIFDMGEKDSKQHSLDRIDVNGDYTPENCRWASRHLQNANRRDNGARVGIRHISGKNRWESRISINNCIYTKTFKSYDEALTHRIRMESFVGLTIDS